MHRLVRIGVIVKEISMPHCIVQAPIAIIKMFDRANDIDLIREEEIHGVPSDV